MTKQRGQSPGRINIIDVDEIIERNAASLEARKNSKNKAWLLDPKDKTINPALPNNDTAPLNDPRGKRQRGPRECVCGTKIKRSWSLCPACLKQYGTDRKTWPKWVRDWVNLEDAKLKNELEHIKNISINDENNYFKITGEKTEPKFNPNETTWEDLNEYREGLPGGLNENRLYNEMSASDKALIYPGDYPSQADGRSKYDQKELDAYSPQDQSAKIWARHDKTEASVNQWLKNPPYNTDTLDENIDLRAAAKILTKRERFILRRKYQGYSQAETAAVLGINQQMVSKIYNRVVKKLKNSGKY